MLRLYEIIEFAQVQNIKILTFAYKVHAKGVLNRKGFPPFSNFSFTLVSGRGEQFKGS